MNDNTNAIVIRDDAIIDVQRSQSVLASLGQEVFKEDIDYGEIPGVKKKSLFKPGAEKVARAFQLRPEYEQVTCIEDFERGLFYFRYRCDLYHIPTGLKVGSCIGSANSQEVKWGWRWVSEDALPPGTDKSKFESRNGSISEFAFAVEKAETTGQYGKPAEYWKRFQDAIDAGEAVAIKKKSKGGKEFDAWQIGGVEYRLPNPNIADVVNTIDKMSQKRAFVGAILLATGASEFYTQDVEDMAGFTVDVDNVVDGHAVELTPEEAAKLSWNQVTIQTFIDQFVPSRVKTTKALSDVLGVKKWSDWQDGYEAAIEKVNQTLATA